MYSELVQCPIYDAAKKKQGKIQIVQVIESIWVYSKPLTFFIV